MKNSLFLEGEILFPLNFEETPDEYGHYNSCTYAHTTYAEPETGYYEDLCELTKNTCGTCHCPMEAKYTVRNID